jgi:uncharacterized lipoprotein NlpE involved in copper resistance
MRMKIFKLIAISAVALLCSCKNEQKQAKAQMECEATPKEIPDAAHNSHNSLDWAGAYKGTTPCMEPCKGIDTQITINQDSTYALTVQAIGQEKVPRQFSGTFHWDKAKNVITLDANGDHHKFQVRENALKELDKFGDPKQLGRQEDYILIKQ